MNPTYTFQVKKLDSFKLWCGVDTSSSGHLNEQLNNTEKVDIGVVNSEVNNNSASTTIDPEAIF